MNCSPHTLIKEQTTDNSASQAPVTMVLKKLSHVCLLEIDKECKKNAPPQVTLQQKSCQLCPAEIHTGNQAIHTQQ